MPPWAVLPSGRTVVMVTVLGAGPPPPGMDTAQIPGVLGGGVTLAPVPASKIGTDFLYMFDLLLVLKLLLVVVDFGFGVEIVEPE